MKALHEATTSDIQHLAGNAAEIVSCGQRSLLRKSMNPEKDELFRKTLTRHLTDLKGISSEQCIHYELESFITKIEDLLSLGTQDPGFLISCEEIIESYSKSIFPLLTE